MIAADTYQPTPILLDGRPSCGISHVEAPVHEYYLCDSSGLLVLHKSPTTREADSERNSNSYLNLRLWNSTESN